VAVCFSVLQSVCRVQKEASCPYRVVYCSVLQCVAVCCSMLQCVAVRLQSGEVASRPYLAVCCSVLQCVSVCCSMFAEQRRRLVAPILRCVAVRCSALQCVAVCCTIFQCAAVYLQSEEGG